MLSYLKRIMNKPSNKGRVGKRELCIGDITENTIWLEVCDEKASDFRVQYGIPKKHYSYSKEQLDKLNNFTVADRNIYNFTLKCINEKGTKWLFQDADLICELPPGYVKNKINKF